MSTSSGDNENYSVREAKSLVLQTIHRLLYIRATYPVHVYLEDAAHRVFKQDEPTYVRIWGLKRGEGVYSKGAH